MCIDSYADISIHTPTRGTTAGTGTATNLAEFQSTFPREERPYYTIVRIQVLQFQSTLPREERPFPTDFVTAFMPYFNPRSHERSDFTGDYTFEVTLISIHAPTRGATHNAGTVGTAKEFQYTLPREERPYPSCLRPLFFYFNPRSHERSDQEHICLIHLLYLISIHAPTRGATVIMVLLLLLKIFQSTLPREERHAILTTAFLIFEFQSTLPREERLSAGILCHL